ncbi:MAG TPA: NAD(P)-dependent oxidoreductase [Flavipsychrobacter sp.]|nr:NAD(P)-dependent oxidoreductase [Flavipsychrobacter sp.]
MKKVLIAAPVHPVLTDGLQAAGYECLIHEKISQQQAFELVKDVTGIITSTRLQLDKSLIDAAPQLQWIGRMGSGMEVIDVPYAETKGIKCFGSPGGNANAVAEHALGMLLSLNKRIIQSNNEVKQGLWLRDENRGTELEGKTIGLIGFGHTGRAFAKKLMGFDMQILAYDKYNRQDFPAYVKQCETLTPIFQQADIISFHVPLQADTTHYFDENFLRSVRKPFILVNTSRGVVVNNEVLLLGMQEKLICGACIDVWEEEPLNVMSDKQRVLLAQVANLPNAVLTPHIAGYSFEAVYKMSYILLQKIVNNL